MSSNTFREEPTAYIRTQIKNAKALPIYVPASAHSTLRPTPAKKVGSIEVKGKEREKHPKVFAQLELVEHERDQQARVDLALDDQVAAVEEHHGEDAHLQKLDLVEWKANIHLMIRQRIEIERELTSVVSRKPT